MTRIWDFRRGDDDDNRMSPQASGLRGVVLSAVLEFNLLKAAIVFLALIIGPALLVGAAPSIVVTYGRLMLHAKTMAGYNPVPGLVLLAVLLAVAFWAGRRLVTAAFDNFRHLHYTLVFPLFVALRELLRVMAERFQGRSITPYQLHRGRRIGAVAATLLFAAAGVALALTVEHTIG